MLLLNRLVKLPRAPDGELLATAIALAARVEELLDRKLVEEEPALIEAHAADNLDLVADVLPLRGSAPVLPYVLNLERPAPAEGEVCSRQGSPRLATRAAPASVVPRRSPVRADT